MGAVLGILAFVAGLTKMWIIEPVASAFESLSPDGKVVVVAIAVAATNAAVAAGYFRRRRSIELAARTIAAHPTS